MKLITVKDFFLKLFLYKNLYSQTNFMNKQFEITRLPSDYKTFIKNCDFSAPT